MITIYGTLYSSKNHRQILRNAKSGKMFIAKPKKAKEAEDGLMIQLKSNIRKWKSMLTAKASNSSPIRVQFKIYRKGHQRFDYVNIIQSLADQMVKAGYMPDDSAEYFIPVFEPYKVDAKNPRTEITIL